MATAAPPKVSEAAAPTYDREGKAGGERLTATKLGEELGLSSRKVNLILAELGWIEKFTKGWKLTDHGVKQGGKEKTAHQSGASYVDWPRSLLSNKVFLADAQELRGGSSSSPDAAESPVSNKPQVEDGRKRYPADYRAVDGHYVRSRAELAIDNWLYMQGIVHAYERKLPVEEDAYCDFYLPESKVYIEYWGMEQDASYAKRKAEKQSIYKKYDLKLVELADAELENLDDNLARLLIPFGVKCE